MKHFSFTGVLRCMRFSICNLDFSCLCRAENCDIRINKKEVSREHAEIIIDHNQVSLNVYVVMSLYVCVCFCVCVCVNNHMPHVICVMPVCMRVHTHPPLLEFSLYDSIIALRLIHIL